MSAGEPLTSQLVELLSVSQATALPPSTDELVIITVRPQPNSFHPHNIALKKAQAVRLLNDLESLLRAPVTALVACLALIVTGCSARLEVERANKTDSTASEARTADISQTWIDLVLQPRSQPPLPSEPPKPAPVVPEFKPVTITGNTINFNFRVGDMTYRSDTHIHIHEPPQRHVEERVVIRQEVHSIPPRPVDEQCEQLRRQYEETVRRWKANPLGE